MDEKKTPPFAGLKGIYKGIADVVLGDWGGWWWGERQNRFFPETIFSLSVFVFWCWEFLRGGWGDLLYLAG